MDETQQFDEFLPEKEIIDTAARYGYADKRKRALIIPVLFYGMVYLSSLKDNGLYPGIIQQLPKIFKRYGLKAETVTKSALSKKLVVMDWRIFRDIYAHLLGKYSSQLETDLGEVLGRFRDIHLVDSTSIRLSILLQDVFEATNKKCAALKLHVKFSLKRFVPVKVEITSQKRHDINFDFVSREKDVLYLFDLGYWCFDVFKKLWPARAILCAV